MENLNKKNKPVYIVGDMNIDILKFAMHPPTENYINNLFASGFLQLITKPTRCQNNSATLIDHLLYLLMKSKITMFVVSYYRTFPITFLPFIFCMKPWSPVHPNLFVLAHSRNQMSTTSLILYVI